MPRASQQIVAFNRGLVSRLATARVDLKRMAFSAKEMVNWMPRAMGSMMLRPGMGYLGVTQFEPRFLPFVRSNDDTALIEMYGDLAIRVWVDDEVISRAAVSTTVSNGTFSSLASWTDADDAGATSSVDGPSGSGLLKLVGTGTAFAKRYQLVSVVSDDQNVEHALNIEILRGPVVLRVGSTLGGSEYISETSLDTGEHSLAFTPTGDFYIQFQSSLARATYVDTCQIEAAGDMSVSGYTTIAAGALDQLRYDQSADVIFFALEGEMPGKIERRGTRSWSVAQYLPTDGPFRVENTTPLTITASAKTGNITLTASAPLFSALHTPGSGAIFAYADGGALFSISSSGQEVTASAGAENTFTGAIRVLGVGTDRTITIVITGTFAATVVLQKSTTSDNGPWTDVGGKTWTAVVNTTFADGLDNQEVWYRMGVKTGGYTSGTAVMTLSIPFGSITGVVRITAVASATSASAAVLKDLGGVAATEVWAEGAWSRLRGFPTSVALYEGRLVWAGKDNVWLTISDDFYGFDQDFQGDAGPISRAIGSGAVDRINWIMPLQRLILGGDSAEHSCRSNAFDEPLTPTNFNIKPASTQGSSTVGAVKIDSRGMFVQRGGTRLFELAFNGETYDYASVDLTILIPEIGQPGISRIAVQRQPDTRIHCVRTDGTAAVLVYDKAENVLCWVELESDAASGLIEDVVILPGEEGTEEDRVYYVVKRTIDGSSVRHLERWAMESECAGGTLNKQADSFIEFTNSPASVTVTGLSHLEGEDVIVWQDGVCPSESDNDIKTYTVTGGAITLDTAATTGIVGLPYTAQWKSAKLGQTLSVSGRIDHLGLILLDTHPLGLRFGPSLVDAQMDYLPLRHQGEVVDVDEVFEEYDDTPVPFPSQWSTDSRLCLKAQAPRPCTICAAVVNGEFNAS